MFSVVACVTFVFSAQSSVPWHHPLYLSNGGLWRQRIAVTVRNPLDRPCTGTPVPVRIGNAEGEAAIVGARVSAIRVCNERGAEMLFGLADSTGAPLRKGSVPAGAVLTIPVECPAHGEARYYIYWDNPEAWTPPDFLDATGALRNGSVEEGQGEVPDGWVHDTGDSRHIASWTTEDAHSGRRCLKLEVARGSEPSWVSTRQYGLRIVGGVRYRMTGWVKAQGVDGYAGWYIHLGNAGNSMIEAPMLSAGGGTYDWKQVTLEFTAPADADRADLGTVLWGTGTAWFDDVTLQPLEPLALPSAHAYPPEKLAIVSVGADAPWWTPGSARDGADPRVRMPVRIIALGGDRPSGFACIRAEEAARLRHGDRRSGGIVVTSNGCPLRHYSLANLILFDANVCVPQRPSSGAHGTATVTTFYLYPAAPRASARAGQSAVRYSMNPAVPGGQNQTSQTADIREYAALLNHPLNLARNASFERGDRLPEAWEGGAEGQRPAGSVLELVDGGLFGRRCARMHIPADATPAWTGWRQDVPVRPGRTYLFAAWLRCENLQGGIQLHVHLRKADGTLVSQSPMQGVGPAISGTTGWTLLAGLFRTPEDCRIFQMHLTMLATGTAWHDGVLLLEVAPSQVLEPQTGPAAGPPFAVWSVNPIVKVFRTDLPPAGAQTTLPLPIRITCAQNEYEPVQIAVRSKRNIRGLQIVIDPPRAPSGVRLTRWETGIVRYVPVDAVTNYYNDNTPAYYRKIPAGPAGSDGWPGWWPDPIVPGDRLDLRANQTVPVWLTLYVPLGTPAAEYSGAVRFVAEGRTLAALPLTVRVRRFALPDRPSLKAIYDTRQSGSMWQLPGKTAAEAREAFWRFMAQHRLCPDTIKPEPVLQYRDGKVEADFTEFDRAARIYFDELKFPHAYTPWHFYLFGWGHLPGEKFGEKPYDGQYPYDGVDRSHLRPEYRRAYQACLRVFWDHVKAMGWADRFVLYISDEPHDHQPAIVAQMKALCDMIHEVDPTIPIYSSTWHHQPEWDGKINVWGIGHYGVVPVEKMRQIREGGARIWWTTDGQMCTDTPYCAIERLLPHYCFKYGAEAYEFWGVDWLTYDPYQFGWHAFLLHDFGVGTEKVYVRYPNGDGFLAYPPAPLKLDRPVPSLRLEQAREGVEDYEYLVLLRRLVEEGRNGGRDVHAGEQALQAASTLVSSPCEIGRYSTRILPNPDRVLQIRAVVGDAIEKLLEGRQAEGRLHRRR